MNIHAAYMNLKVLNDTFDVDPTFLPPESNNLAGYTVSKGGQVYMTIPTNTTLSEHQIQSLIYSKLTGKPSEVVKKSFLLRKVWAQMSKSHSCRQCRAMITHGSICDLCYNGVNTKGH